MELFFVVHHSLKDYFPHYSNELVQVLILHVYQQILNVDIYLLMSTFVHSSDQSLLYLMHHQNQFHMIVIE